MNAKKIAWALGACLLLTGSFSLAALDEAEKQYVDRLIKGGWPSIRDVAERSLQHRQHQHRSAGRRRRGAAREISACRGRPGRRRCDLLAVPRSRQFGEWPLSCRARTRRERQVGASQGAEPLRESRQGTSEGCRQHVRRRYRESRIAAQSAAATASPAPAAGKGKKGAKPAATPVAAVAPAPPPAAAPAPKKVDFGIIKEGMSQAEVDGLIGQPTAQTQHMTGKQWQPFNFGAHDLQRLYYLYKGVGRIEFSMKSG